MSSTRSTDKGTYTNINGSDVMYSKKTRYGHRHELQRGQAGDSYEENNYVRHTDPKGVTTGFDRIRLAKNIIEHFDAKQNPVGQTAISNEQENVYLSTDESELMQQARLLELFMKKQTYDGREDIIAACEKLIES